MIKGLKSKIKVKNSCKDVKKKSNNQFPNDEKFTRVVDAALRAGKKFNMIIMERTEEMMQLVHQLNLRVDSVNQDPQDEQESKQEESKNQNEENENGDASMMMPTSVSEPTKSVKPSTTAASTDSMKPTIMLTKVQSGLSQLQDLLAQLQFASVQTEVELIKQVKLPAITNPQSIVANGEQPKKTSHSRLYTAVQQNKLEEWYQLSSRPEAAEINAMHRVINSPAYAAMDIQPDGISAKQIRIWFDNRRAKERTDYMRVKMKEARTKGLEPEAIKQMKVDFLGEAKEVLEARVSRLRENSQGALMIVEEGRTVEGSTVELAETHAATPTSKAVTNKKRLRIDYVASVRKAVRDARDSGKTEEEIKDIRNAAIERARERVHIPTKAGRTNSKYVGKEEVTHVKFKLLKMLEEEAPPEEVADIMELLASLNIPKSVLTATRITRQLKLAAKAYKDKQWLVKDIQQLIDRFGSLIEADEDEATESTEKKVRVKFSLGQVKKLETCFLTNAQPSKKIFEKICAKLNEPPLRNDSVPPIEVKQVRCWFYKRRAANQPPTVLQGGEAGDEVPVSGMSQDEMSQDESDLKPTTALPSVSVPATTPTRRPSTASSSSGFPMTSSGGGDSGNAKGGRLFSAEQVALIRKEYDMNNRPRAAQVDEMCKIMNTKEYQDLDKNPFGVTRRQVMTWFSNRRAKERADFVKSKVREARDAGLAGEDIEKVREIADMEIKEKMDIQNRNKGTKRKRPDPTDSKASTDPALPGQDVAPEEASETEDDADNDISDDDDLSDENTASIEVDEDDDTEDDDVSIEDMDRPSSAKKMKLLE